ncbi:uncharacterized protein LOC136007529 isoform X4 [Lathamus discolor]|uniref:uncharacterized protein LOC136007529 isoform X4 n=1 Tax=Lathamus discolor TaxID=678569 RepID=UPI0032B809B0
MRHVALPDRDLTSPMDGIACGFDRDVKSKEQQCPCAAVCATRGSSASTLVSYTTSAPCFFSSRCSTALALCFKAATASFRMRIMNSFCSQRHLKEKTVFRRDFIQSVKKDLSTMVSNLPDENKLPLSKITSFKGFQTMPAPPGTEMQQDAAGFTSAALEKEPEWQTKETSWQELKMWLEEKEKDLIKEKSKISQEKRLVMQQDKILEVRHPFAYHRHADKNKPLRRTAQAPGTNRAPTRKEGRKLPVLSHSEDPEVSDQLPKKNQSLSWILNLSQWKGTNRDLWHKLEFAPVK